MAKSIHWHTRQFRGEVKSRRPKPSNPRATRELQSDSKSRELCGESRGVTRITEAFFCRSSMQLCIHVQRYFTPSPSRAACTTLCCAPKQAGHGRQQTIALHVLSFICVKMKRTAWPRNCSVQLDRHRPLQPSNGLILPLLRRRVERAVSRHPLARYTLARYPHRGVPRERGEQAAILAPSDVVAQRQRAQLVAGCAVADLSARETAAGSSPQRRALRLTSFKQAPCVSASMKPHRRRERSCSKM